MKSINGKRVVCITDIHGRYETFMSLLEKTKLDCDNDILVLCGDAIGRGQSEDIVLLELEMLKEAMKDRMVWLLGNHEDDLLESFVRGYPLSPEKKDIAVRLLRQHLDDHFEFAEAIFVHGAYHTDNRYVKLMGGRRIISGGELYKGKVFIAGHNEVEKPVYIDQYGKKTFLFNGMKLPEKGSIYFDTSWNPLLKRGSEKMTALIIEDGLIDVVQVPIAETDKFFKNEDFFW